MLLLLPHLQRARNRSRRDAIDACEAAVSPGSLVLGWHRCLNAYAIAAMQKHNLLTHVVFFFCAFPLSASHLLAITRSLFLFALRCFAPVSFLLIVGFFFCGCPHGELRVRLGFRFPPALAQPRIPKLKCEYTHTPLCRHARTRTFIDVSVQVILILPAFRKEQLVKQRSPEKRNPQLLRPLSLHL